MITRNFDNLMKFVFTGWNVVTNRIKTTEDTWKNGGIGIVKDINGDYSRIHSGDLTSNGLFGGTSDRYVVTNVVSPTMLVGSNDADESYDDYTISVLSSLTVLSDRGNAYTYSAENATLKMIKTFVNDTSDDITVSEVGIFKCLTTTTDTSSTSSSRNFLLFREKLPEPVILTANGGTATFTVTMNFPVANKPNE